MSRPIRVLVADDHPIVRRGIRDLLETEPGIAVVGEAADGAAAVDIAVAEQPDLVIMDLVMPVMDGIEATRRIRAALPETRVLVLTSFTTDDKVFPAIKAGALGYVIKDTEPATLIDAVRRVAAGEVMLHQSVAQKLLREIAAPPPDERAEPEIDPLTERELEVLKLIARGLSNQEIAEALVISVTTVYTHVSNILGKLHLATRTQAALYALRAGIATLHDDE